MHAWRLAVQLACQIWFVCYSFKEIDTNQGIENLGKTYPPRILSYGVQSGKILGNHWQLFCELTGIFGEETLISGA